MAGRLVSSGTLGFCFIFCFLFSYGGTFTHVFRPMQGSPHSVPQLTGCEENQMLQFDHAIVFLKRPITVVSVSDALSVKPFELMHDLMALEIFVSPSERLEGEEVRSLGDRIGVDFRIDEEGGSSTKPIRPISPLPPQPSQGQEEFPLQ